MLRFSAKFLVSLGLVLFLVGLLLFAAELDLIPDPVRSEWRSRARLCETIAMGTSLMAARGDTESINSFLEAVLKRNADVISIGIRRRGKYLTAETAGHDVCWNEPTEFERETRFQVPILDGADREWGIVEVAFQPLSRPGLARFTESHLTKLLVFIATLAFLTYYLYLGKILKVLNAKSVPQRVRTALNTLAGGLIVVDGNGDVVLANDAVASWVGRDPDELLGKPVSDLPWILQDKALPWSETLEFKTAVIGDTTKLAAVDGDRTLIVNATPMVANSGELRGVFIGLEDITVLEQKEVEHKKLREEAERANSAKSEFLARMSHEIRTPMNAILGFTDVLRRGFDRDDEERDEYLGTIHSSGEHLLSIINDILDLSKVESGRMDLEYADCSPHKIILETLQVLQVKAEEKGLVLEYEPEDGLPQWIRADDCRLRQIVMNLVGNAIKFTHQGRVRVTSRLVGSMFEFRVIDTGIGMEQDALEKIFEPFGQADSSVTRQFGGTGLGLAIAKRFTEAMGGRIEVSSKQGEGTTFTVQIDPGPLEEVPPVSAAEALMALDAGEPPIIEADLPRCRILVVDDGASNRTLLRVFLQRSGATIVEAENGLDAIHCVEDEDFDVILLDMQMPVMDGYTAATRLRETGCLTPIVALTAHAMKQDEEKCLAAGCSHFLPKPVESNRLLQLIGDILGGDVREVRSKPHKRSFEARAQPSSSSGSLQPQMESELPMDDEEFRQVVFEFVERLYMQLDEMDQAFQSARYDRLAELAHWLKGAGGTAGFREFTKPARELETLANQDDPSKLGEAIQRIRSMAARIVLPNPCPPSPMLKT